MLEKCPHCGAEVLFLSDFCPNCQRSRKDASLLQTAPDPAPPLKEKPRNRKLIAAMTLGLAILAFAAFKLTHRSAPQTDEVTLIGKVQVTMEYQGFSNEGMLGLGVPVPRLVTQYGTYTLRTSTTTTRWVNMKLNGSSVIYNLGERHRVKGRFAEDDKSAIWVTYIEDLSPKKAASSAK